MHHSAFDYPVTTAETTAVQLGGKVVPDPYYWLAQDSPRVQAWVAEQNRLTSHYLAGLPMREFVSDAIRRYDVARPDQLPRFAAGSWFWISINPESGRPAVWTGPEFPTSGRILYDTTGLESAVPTVTWISPSSDAKILALGLCEDGSENNRIILVDVSTGLVLPEAPEIALMDNWTGGVHWLPNNSGFYFTGLPNGSVDGGFEVFLHDLTSKHSRRAEIDWPHEAEYRGVFIRPGTTWAIAVQGLSDPVPIAVLDLADPHAKWRSFIPEAEGGLPGQVFADQYIAVTFVGADRGRIVSIPLAGDGSVDTWREIVPESTVVFRTVIPAGDRFYVTLFNDTYSGVHIYGLNGEFIDSVSMPARAAITEGIFPIMNLTRPTFETTPLFVVSTLTTSWGIYKHNPSSGGLDTIVAPAITIPDAIVEEGTVRSKDGTPVRYHVLGKRRTEAGPRPALIFAYGASNRPLIPEFPGAMAAIVEAGGIFVHAHIRGGSEFGLRWWLEGRAHNKQNGYDDLYAVAEDLIEKGLTRPAQLAVAGKSNGGMMAGVAMTQRPDLWAAAVPLVPVLDLVDWFNRPYLRGSIEFGDPNDPQDLERILATSPYHAIKAGAAYPALLAIAGATDPRCPPCHVSKFIARLQSAQAKGKPALMRIHENEGHGAAAAADVRVRLNAEWLTFVLSEIVS
ncbi:prolyl oligopeptidase family serine peptidase [Bradyrhizobium sp. DOA9]|uniref:prolyl oligopeptidase family serine peptidase n=1 Tax=Bradyrhizobium sp. DOA9 TaxID=1126627 RepID=UPI00046A5DE0|nr:prolyl oligopeptidase family serine peptidase [Bradyrhizobium sp. DOA9]GAJ37570.1 prolyl endopeptidase precursor [Bradyrhizobium sp. DOA9]